MVTSMHSCHRPPLGSFERLSAGGRLSRARRRVARVGDCARRLISAARSARGAAGLDECGQAGDFDRVGDFQSRPEIVPEFDALFFAGFEQAEKGVSAVAAAIASGSSADLALRHVVADGVFRCVVWSVFSGRSRTTSSSGPVAKVAIDRAPRWQILWDGAPLASLAQHLNQTVHQIPFLAPLSGEFGRHDRAGGISGAICAHSASVTSLGYRRWARSYRARFSVVHIGSFQTGWPLHGDCLKIGGQAAIAIDGNASLAGLNLRP